MATTNSPQSHDDLRARILDAALTRADRQGWETVRLWQVAADLDIPLAAVHLHYREKEDLVDAWLDRADRHMLQVRAQPDFPAMTTRQRLQALISAWLTVLSAHRRVTRQMILGKLEPGHLHVQIPAVLRISRTVQWLREAAGCEARYLRRALEESVLTGIFVTVFITWLRDHSPDQSHSLARLDRCLAQAEAMALGGLPCNCSHSPAATTPGRENGEPHTPGL